MMRDFAKRRGGSVGGAKGIRELYPTASAGSREYPNPAACERVPTDVAEPRAIRCRQCGHPIPDTAEISNCPFCDSDNFEGQVVSR